MNLKKISLLLVVGLLNPFNAFASDLELDRLDHHLRELSEDEVQEEMKMQSYQAITGSSALTEVGVAVEIFDKLVVLGEKVYSIVKKGEAVMNVQKQTWSVLPKETLKAKDLTEWKAPVNKGYELVYTNLLGMEVVKVRYLVNFVYGGRFEGKGAYLAHISVVPSSVNVNWGFDVDVSVESREAINVGTEANPVAALSFDVVVKTSSIMTKQLDTVNYFIDGQGRLKENN